MRHDELDSDEVLITTFEVLNNLILIYVSLLSPESPREYSQLSDILNVIKYLEQTSDLAFNISKPPLVRLQVVAEYIYLYEMVEFLEELYSFE